MEDNFITPGHLKNFFPLSKNMIFFLKKTQEDLEAVSKGLSKKKILLIGPCSIHNVEGIIEYTKKLIAWKNEYNPDVILLLRCHLEKPRTKNDWRGFVADPKLDGSYEIEKGILLSRKLMLDLLNLGVALSSELLDPFLLPYFDDCLSFATIGARSIQSPIHRLMASSTSFPIGFKNRTDGNIDCAIDAIKVANSPQTILSINSMGQIIKKRTLGNPFSFLILRGAETFPNYTLEWVIAAKKKLSEANLSSGLIIDCSHGNGKWPNSIKAIETVMDYNNSHLIDVQGISFESYLKSGKFNNKEIRNAPYDISITDSCISLEETLNLLNNKMLFYKSS